MNLPQIKTNMQRKTRQTLTIGGLNLTDNFKDGQMLKTKHISTKRYPYISTSDRMEEVSLSDLIDGWDETKGYKAVSIFGWEKLFIVTNEPSTTNEGWYKCYYGGTYCGDVKNLKDKQYAVINSKLVVWPDKLYFNLYAAEDKSYELQTAPLLAEVNAGTATFVNSTEGSDS